MKIKIYSWFGAISAAAALFPLHTAQAVCPVCTVAVFAGLGLSRWLKIDDTISGIWIGAAMISLILWTSNWLKNKKRNTWWAEIINVLLYFGLIIEPLFYYKIIGHPYNTLWGMDKLLLGICVGGILFLAATKTYEFLKQKNGGHAHFPYEKVVIPVAALILASLIFYFLTR